MAEAGTEIPAFRRDVGIRLRRIEEHFRNREEAAKAAGVSKATLQRWVHGTADPSFEGLARLAAETGYSLDWLATGEGPERRGGAQLAPATSAPARDVVLLTVVLKEIEDWLDRSRRRLPARRKAEVVWFVYDQLQKDRSTGNETPPKTEVDRVLRLVV